MGNNRTINFDETKTSYGNSDGYGYGDGDGYGNGYGNGYGDGNGCGYGNGTVSTASRRRS